MVELMFAEPGVEQIAFMPSIAGARRFSRAAWQSAGIGEFVVADDGGEVVGFAWVSDHGVSLRQGARRGHGLGASRSASIGRERLAAPARRDLDASGAEAR
jgi:hypothetical protein